jgi:hypothetical protein
MSKFVDEEVGYSIDLPQVTTPGVRVKREAYVWRDVVR